MKKILLFGATPFQGGIETFIMNICKVMNYDNEIYIYNFSNQKIAYQDILTKKFGVKVLQVANVGGKLGHFSRKIQYKQFFKKFKFDIVHVNANSPSNYDFALAALTSGAKVIYHSHNDSAESFVMDKKYKNLISQVRSFQRKRLSSLDVKRVAVSDNAAKWMFDNNQDVQIIPNGVDFDKVKFSSEKRVDGRSMLHILTSDTTLLVASRLTAQKNIGKSLSIAKLAIEKDVAQHLIIVGDGEEMPLIKETVNYYPQDIKQKIHVLGAQSDMQLWYSVGDILLMPSIYEGLPYSVLEAQANGLSILASNAIPQQAVITENLISFMDVQENDEMWVQNMQLSVNRQKRKEYVQVANQSRYSLKNFESIMDNLYETV